MVLLVSLNNTILLYSLNDITEKLIIPCTLVEWYNSFHCIVLLRTQLYDAIGLHKVLHFFIIDLKLRSKCLHTSFRSAFPLQTFGKLIELTAINHFFFLSIINLPALIFFSAFFFFLNNGWINLLYLFLQRLCDLSNKYDDKSCRVRLLLVSHSCISLQVSMKQVKKTQSLLMT